MKLNDKEIESVYNLTKRLVESIYSILDSDFSNDSIIKSKKIYSNLSLEEIFENDKEAFIKDWFDEQLQSLQQYKGEFEFIINYLKFLEPTNLKELKFSELYHMDLLPLIEKLEDRYKMIYKENFKIRFNDKDVKLGRRKKDKDDFSEKEKIILNVKEQSKLIYLFAHLKAIPNKGNASAIAKEMLHYIKGKAHPEPGEYQHLRTSMRGKIDKNTKAKFLKLFADAIDFLKGDPAL